MDTVNPEQARRVWNRVHPESGDGPSPDLEPLISGEWEAAAAYLTLAKRTGSRHTAVLQQLARRSRSRWACLQGMELLRAGKRPGHTHPQPLIGSAGELLRHCCGRAVAQIALYEQIRVRGTDPIVSLLAQEQAGDCRILLELLGNWGD